MSLYPPIITEHLAFERSRETRQQLEQVTGLLRRELVLLLVCRDGLSDERAMEALRFNPRWKVALDLPIDHPGFH